MTQSLITTPPTPPLLCRISTPNSLLWADAAKRMEVPSPCSTQSGVMISPREGQAAGIFHLSQLHVAEAQVQAGMVKKTRSLFLHPAPTLTWAKLFGQPNINPEL